MRALAEFIMRGRLQAAVVAFVGNLLPFISPAAVGLVALRKGPLEGLLTLMWAVLPVVLMFSAEVPVELITSLAQLVILWFAADQLRRSQSWAMAILVVVGLSGLAGMVFNMTLPEGVLMEQIRQMFERFVVGQPADVQLDQATVLSVLVILTALATVISLVLARWWQAMLYNPGGFRAEFHQLRYSMSVAFGLVGAILVCTVLEGNFLVWINVLALPLMIAGVSLVHWLVAERNLGLQTLVLFYIGVMVIPILFIPMLVVIGFTDSMVNLRSRLKSGAS
ncbi:hypothetical protein QP938_03470 [Porticoccaceae bacterium LTM1]|nr:hypothetical protein QP938_03470 [Porticoccaceae bacterium LTM1]